MVTQHPPFFKAEPTDPHYRLLAANRADLFWKAHAQDKPGGLDFFPKSFQEMITAMLSYDPSHRPSIAEIKACDWYNSGSTATLTEIQSEFQKRKDIIEEEAREKRKQKEIERAQK
jgi:hypothetical protein